MSWAAGLAAAGVVLAAGCAGDRPRPRGPSTVQAVVVRAGAQCGGDEAGPSARWIGTEGTFRAAMGEGGAFAAADATPIDFGREGVLAVYMGQRPTGGYALGLQDPTVAIANRVGTVVVRFQEPAPGAMVPQVLTSPCLLLKLPKDDLREVRVVDPTGLLRATAPVRVRPSEPERPPPFRR